MYWGHFQVWFSDSEWLLLYDHPVMLALTHPLHLVVGFDAKDQPTAINLYQFSTNSDLYAQLSPT